MKNIIKLLLPIIACGQAALAVETGIILKTKGSFDFGVAAIKDNGTESIKSMSANRDGVGFFSSGSVTLNLENRLEDDMAYGAKIALVTAIRSDRKTPSMMFFESHAGKIELGSDKSATTKMKITGLSNSSATGGTLDMCVLPNISDKKIAYVKNTGNFLDAKSRDPKDLEYSRKITYFTPEFNGFQAGVSYILDTGNAGHNSMKDPEYHMSSVAQGYTFDIKDGVGWGLAQKIKVDDDLSFRAALVGEFGKVVARDNNTRLVVKDKKFKNLRTYTFGAEMKYTQFAISGCYSNYMKSLTSRAIDPADRTKSDLYSVGAKYSFDQLSISAHYFTSNNRKNKFNATTLATDYKLAQGLLPYAEVTAYNSTGWFKEKSVYTVDKHRGVLFVMGMRMEF